MSDVLKKKFEVPVVTEKPTQQESSASSVEFNLHSCYYRDFFLLRTPITINGRPADIKVINGDPVLVVDSSGDRSISIKLAAISLKAVGPVLTKHGVYHINTFYHELEALYSISFRSKSSLRRFLDEKEAVGKEIATAISKMCSAKTKPAKQPSSSQPKSDSTDDTAVGVNVEVYLVSPSNSGKKKQPNVFQVSLANYPFTAQTWEESKLFDFNSAMFTDTAKDSGGSERADLPDLQRELGGVIAWFSLGVQLKIPENDLLAIRKDHRDQTEDCRLQMLIRWGELEKPTWSKLVKALVDIGRKALAEDLAMKYGLPHPFQTVKKSPQNTDLSMREREFVCKSKELEEARLLKNDTSEKVEKETRENVPILEGKVKSLNSKINILKRQLKNRNEELEMFHEIEPSVREEKIEVLDRLVKEKSAQIKLLKEDLDLKEEELNTIKETLQLKEKKLARLIEELSTKSTRVLELEEELEKLRHSFKEQEEEMNRKVIEASVRAVSHKKYLEEIEIQKEYALMEATKKKEEVEQYSQILASKEEHIRELSLRITKQEREISQLRTDRTNTHRFTSPLEEMTEEEREHQLHTLRNSIILLKLELMKAEEQKRQQLMKAERAREDLQKYQKTRETPLSELKLPLKLKWRRGRDMPFGRYGSLNVVVVGDKIYVRGGWSESDEGRRTVTMYNIIKNTWTSLPLYDYEFFVMTALNSQLVLLGGQHPSTWKRTNTLSVWSDEQRQYIHPYPPMGVARCSPSVVTYRGWIVVAGGNGSGDERLSEVELLNTSARQPQWYRAAPLPQPRSQMKSTIIGNMLYLIGGLDKNGFTTLVHCVNIDDLISDAVSKSTGAHPSTSPSATLWSSIPDTPLRLSAALNLQGSLLAVGGDDKRQVDKSDIFLYQASKKKWIKVGDLPSARTMCGCAVLSNGEIVVVGGSGTENRIDIATMF